MKSLVNFSGSALSRTEMKNVKGGACAVVHWSGGAKGAGIRQQSPSIFTKAEAIQWAKQGGAGYGWCCTSCA